MRKTIKKAQSGTTSSRVTSGEGNRDYTSYDGKMYNTVVRTNTSQGPRYYSSSSPNYEMSTRMANSRAMRQGSDSTTRASLSKSQLKELGEKRRGGKVKRAKTGTIVPKKSSVSKRLGSAKKSIGTRSMKRK